MKKKVCCFFSILMVFGIVAFFASCDIIPDTQKTPVAGDYTFGNLNQTAGSVTAVTITPKSGKSPGAVSNIRYEGNTAIPQAVGTYAVTFDVAEAEDWEAATGLSAGNLVVTTGGNQTPVAGDYTFSRFSQTAGSVTAVVITPKSDKSPGTVSNIRYNNSTTVPQTAGTFAVIFDVAVASGWNAAADLSAGNLTVLASSPNNQTPTASDYDFEKLGQTAGSVTAVTITVKSGKSPGTVTNIRYAGNTAIPQTAGTFAVTFDVEAAPGWNIGTDLSAGNLTVNAVGDDSKTPVAGDYTFGNMNQTAENVTAVTISPKSEKSPGTVGNIRYSNSTTLPQTVGTFAVTFDVAASGNWKAVNGLSAGNLVVASSGTPGLNFYLIKAGETSVEANVGTYRVSAGTVPRGAVIIPANYDGKAVTEIDLPPVSYPLDSNEGAFSSIPIISVTIPSSVKIIGSNAFANCKSLSSVTFEPGSGLKDIGNWAFYDCTGLNSVAIPAGVTTIGYNAFNGCSSLPSVNIPASVKDIGNRAFANCDNLTSITVAAANTEYASESGILYDKDKKYFILIPNAISGAVTIPNSITEIGAEAFNGRTDLTSVTIPANVESIGYSAFVNCTKLTSVTFTGTSKLETIGSYAFAYTKLSSITIPASVELLTGDIFSNCTSLTSINVETANATYASDNGILYNKSKTHLIQVPVGKSGAVTIPNGVTDIVNSAFSNCTKLTSVTIPASVTSIGNNAFGNCEKLATVTFTGTSGLQTIGQMAFNYCALTSITIPNNGITIGEAAFYGNPLTKVTIGANVTLQPYIYEGNSYQMVFPDGLDEVYEDEGKAAGTYIRPNKTSDEWTKQS